MSGPVINRIPADPPAPQKGSRRLVVQAVLSLAVGIVCVAFTLHGMDGAAVSAALRSLSIEAIGIFLLTMAATHLFRAWRWEYLLRALGTSLPFGRLMLISSAGFMAIIGLPFRLGELVRPYLAAREGKIRMGAMLGAVAVERIVDGLLISIFFFGATLAAQGDEFSPELRFAAWVSMAGFAALTAFLIAAHVWTEQTIEIVIRLTFLPRWLPGRVTKIRDRLRSLISGFRALADRRNFSIFLFQSLTYWGVNGVGTWILAREMGLPISLGAAYAIMAFTGVVLTLPNSPGQLGQYHAAVKLGLLAYLPAAIVNAQGVAYAIALHGIQTLWYVTLGLLSLPGLSRRGAQVSLRDAVRGVGAEDVG
jgi:glycosyltransferase 2 family protein